MAVRTYVYVSDSKVDDLFEQIPRKIRDRIAGELKLDLQLLSVSLREDATTEARMARVAAIDRYFSKEEARAHVGSADETKLYFQDTLDVRWAPLASEPQAIYFDASTGQTLIGLVGSRRHVRGEKIDAPTVKAYSLAYTIFELLASEQDLELQKYATPVMDAESVTDTAYYARAIRSMHRAMARYPSQKMRFLARNEFHHEARDSRQDSVVVGSPVWVARAEAI